MVNNKTTDENGTCTITGVEKGSLTITVNKEGYIETSKTITVNKNETVDFVLDEQKLTRKISFSVINSSANEGENAVQGAVVSVGNKSSTTGSAGGCTLNDIEDGEQNVTVTASGFEEYNSVIIVSEDNISFVINLTPSG